MSEYRIIEPSNPSLVYSGRIDWNEKKEPLFVYPCTCVTIHFIGACLRITLTNKRQYWNSYLGVRIDGGLQSIRLEEGTQTVSILGDKEQKEHTIMIYKRMDACHVMRIHSFEIEKEALLLESHPLPKRRIEVYGDSVSAGESTEAVGYVKRSDPVHNGEYSNSYYSYAWITARKLHAEIHDIAQGGIALLNNTGWFDEPDYIGMEQIYDKVQYYPEAGEVTSWDFSKYTPHVVIVAIGQNDNHPVDYMKEDYDCKQSVEWRQHYKAFISRIRELYNNALIILTTTILEHDAAWDKSIEEVCQELKDEKIVHFLYQENGTGTPGHIRIPEAEKMANELTAFIESFGEEIWNDYGTNKDEDREVYCARDSK